MGVVQRRESSDAGSVVLDSAGAGWSRGGGGGAHAAGTRALVLWCCSPESEWNAASPNKQGFEDACGVGDGNRAAGVCGRRWAECWSGVVGACVCECECVFPGGSACVRVCVRVSVFECVVEEVGCVLPKDAQRKQEDLGAE